MPDRAAAGDPESLAESVFARLRAPDLDVNALSGDLSRANLSPTLRLLASERAWAALDHALTPTEVEYIKLVLFNLWIGQRGAPDWVAGIFAGNLHYGPEKRTRDFAAFALDAFTVSDPTVRPMLSALARDAKPEAAVRARAALERLAGVVPRLAPAGPVVRPYATAREALDRGDAVAAARALAALPSDDQRVVGAFLLLTRSVWRGRIDVGVAAVTALLGELDGREFGGFPRPSHEPRREFVSACVRVWAEALDPRDVARVLTRSLPSDRRAFAELAAHVCSPPRDRPDEGLFYARYIDPALQVEIRADALLHVVNAYVARGDHPRARRVLAQIVAGLVDAAPMSSEGANEPIALTRLIATVATARDREGAYAFDAEEPALRRAIDSVAIVEVGVRALRGVGNAVDASVAALVERARTTAQRAWVDLALNLSRYTGPASRLRIAAAVHALGMGAVALHLDLFTLPYEWTTDDVRDALATPDLPDRERWLAHAASARAALPPAAPPAAPKRLAQLSDVYLASAIRELPTPERLPEALAALRALPAADHWWPLTALAEACVRLRTRALLPEIDALVAGRPDATERVMLRTLLGVAHLDAGDRDAFERTIENALDAP